jgi:hypothetical protein
MVSSFALTSSRASETSSDALQVSYFDDVARSVVRYEPIHKSALRTFQRLYFGPATRHSSDEFADWLFERNPHRDPDGPSLWLCIRDGVVVGQQATIPVILKVHNAERRAAWLIDWMIHPQWRMRGVALALLSASAEHHELMLGLGLEDVAYKTVHRAGWTDVGRLSLFVRPLDAGACARALNRSGFIGKLVPRALLGGSARVIRRVAAAITGITAEPIAAFDERVDEIWDKAGGDHAVLVKRDYVSVRWRYDDGPFRGLYQRYYFKRGGETVGYAVLRFAKWRGQPVGRVVDYLVERRWAAPVLATIIDELNAKGAIAALFEQWHPGSERVLRLLGCMRTRPSHRFMFKLHGVDAPLAHALAQANSWFLMPGDSDFDNVLVES